MKVFLNGLHRVAREPRLPPGYFVKALSVGTVIQWSAITGYYLSRPWREEDFYARDPGVARETRLPPATFYHRYAVVTLSAWRPTRYRRWY